MNKHLIMGIIIVGFLIIGKISEISSASTPREALSGLMEEIQLTEVNGLVQALGIQSLSDADLKQIKNRFANITYDVIDITEEGDLAQIWMVIQLGDETYKELKIMFEKHDERWISSMSASQMIHLIAFQYFSLDENDAKSTLLGSFILQNGTK